MARRPQEDTAGSGARAEIERLAWLLDEAVPLPGGYRIGVDGIVGLIPGVGDLLGMGASAYVILLARRLGVPRHILLQMIGNVAVETVIGAIPLVGDLFDFAWKANTRNLQLLRSHCPDPDGAPARDATATGPSPSTRP